MLSILNPLRELNTLTVCFRMILAFACGTVIGLERSYRNKPAGFRTHTLVCLAACIASLTGLYLYLIAHLPTDVSRIGAQIISGLGFLGAGTIVVTKRNTVKGLTTAAGIWTTGIIGLAIGAGYYEGGIFAAFLVLLIETDLSPFRHNIRQMKNFCIIVTYHKRRNLDGVLRFCKDQNMTITNLKVSGTEDSEEPVYSATITLRAAPNVDVPILLKQIRNMEGVISAEEQ